MWGGLNNVVQQGLGLLFGIMLGRLLSPHDYGMTAMIAIFTIIATILQDSGFKSAIANLQQPTHRDYNAVFWFNIIVGCCCYAILFATAPLIAAFYHQPELVPLCRVAFLSIVFASLGSAQSAYLFRNLMVKQQAICNMSATICSNIVGVSMAFAGCGYWALATQSLVYIGMNSLLLWHFSDWRPTLKTDFTPIRSMFRFSSKLLVTSILERINTNVMNILLGRYFTKVEVGNYNQAYQWNSKIVYLLQGTLQQIAQPVFTTTADERERQLHILRKLIRFTAFLSFPMLFGFSLVAKEFILITIGEKWLQSAELLQLLCVCGAFFPLSTVLTNLLISKGKSNIYLYATLVLCILLIGTMIALHPYGIKHMVLAYVGIYILWTFVWHALVSRQTGYRLLHFLADTTPFAIIALSVMATTGFITHAITSPWLLLTLRIGMATILYASIMKVLRVKIFDECLQFLLNKIKKS